MPEESPSELSKNLERVAARWPRAPTLIFGYHAVHTTRLLWGARCAPPVCFVGRSPAPEALGAIIPRAAALLRQISLATLRQASHVWEATLRLTILGSAAFVRKVR